MVAEQQLAAPASDGAPGLPAGPRPPQPPPPSLAPAAPSQPPPRTDHHHQHTMFITVKYGDNLQQIFNPNCRNNVLLHNIKERCDCDEADIVELSDESGTVKNLHKNLTDYGVEYFTDREILVLLRVDKETDGEDDRPIFIPLVEGLEEDKDFIERYLSSRATTSTASAASISSEAKLNPRPSSSDKRSLQDGRSSKTGSRRAAQKQKQVKKERSARNGGSSTPKGK